MCCVQMPRSSGPTALHRGEALPQELLQVNVHFKQTAAPVCLKRVDTFYVALFTRCSECSNVLLAGAYKPGKEPGCFICSDHQNTKNGYNKPPSGVVIQTGCPSGNFESRSDTSRVQSVSRPTSVPSTPIKLVLRPVETTSPAPQPRTSSAQRTQAARQRFFQSPTSAPEGPSSSQKPSGLPTVPLSPEEEKNRARTVITKKLVEANCNNNNTRYFVIRPAERR